MKNTPTYTHSYTSNPPQHKHTKKKKNNPQINTTKKGGVLELFYPDNVEHDLHRRCIIPMAVYSKMAHRQRLLNVPTKE